MSTTLGPTTGVSPARLEKWGGGSAPLPVTLVAVIAVLTAVPVIQGKLQALVLVSGLALPFIATAVLRDKWVRRSCLALILWAAGQMISDESNGLGPRLSMHFVSSLAMLCIVPVLVHLSRADPRRSRGVVAGVAAGLVLEAVLVEHVSLSATASWKFELNTPVAIVVLALSDVSWQRGRRASSVLALGGICGLGILTDDRHLSAIAVLTGVLLLVRNRQRHPKTVSVLAGVSLLLAALSGAFLKGAGAGLLGERSGEQIAQFGGTPQSILVNVRPEPFQELYLFTLRPVLGWGSLPRLDSAAYLGSINYLRRLGVVREDLDDIWLRLQVPGVSAHSQAMDSLVRAGVSAAPFWLLLVGLAVLVGTRAIRFQSSPLLVLWTTLILWDAIFSPLTGLSHVELGTYLALVVVTIGQHREQHDPRA